MAEAIVTTEKDAIKLSSESFEKPLAAVRVEFAITRGEAALEGLLEGLIRQSAPVATAR